MFHKLFVKLLFTATLVILVSCSTTKKTDTSNPDEVYKEALRLFNDEDWLESTNMFNVIRLQYPASQYADDAQYYLAEIDYKKGDYILAAYNYNRLRSSFPGSEYSKESLFKTAKCYYELSPPYDRDQDYTKKAIDAFNMFQRLYPNDNLYAEGSNYITELREKLGNREFFTAELYRKMNDPGASLVYYQSVIDDYPDTKFYEPAYYGKIEVLAIMKRKDEALGIIDLYKKLFADGRFLNEVKKTEDALKIK